MSKLFEPIKVNHLLLNNRLVMPPMATAKADAYDHVTDEVCDYYRERAKYSGISLIITEHCYIHPQGKAHPGQMSIASDDAIPGFMKLTNCIHDHDVSVFAQINHAGTAAKSLVTGQDPVGPSAVYHPKQKQELPKQMTQQQIHETVSWFAQAARRTKDAGFDGVEIHSAHGYLLNQFFSPLYNHRTDEYGSQSVENRTRFHREIVDAIRKETGNDFPLAIRLGGCDYEAGGSTLHDCVEACQLFEDCSIDLLHLTGGMNGYIRPGHSEPGYFQDMSVLVKQSVKIPVILTGGVTSILQAETLIENQSADMIGVGRAIYKNAHWDLPTKK